MRPTLRSQRQFISISLVKVGAVGKGPAAAAAVPNGYNPSRIRSMRLANFSSPPPFGRISFRQSWLSPRWP